MSTVANWAERVAVVTGGGSGIGRAVATRLADDGYAVAVIDANDVGAKRTAEIVSGTGGRSTAYAADITDEERVRAVVGEIRTDLGEIDVLVNAAGIFDQNLDFEELTSATWERVLRVNVLGTANLMRAVGTCMVERGRGAIVNVASSAGLVPRGGGSAYIASKFAVVGMTLKIAAEYAGRGVRVNAVAPGWIPTDLFTTSAAALRRAGGSVPDDPSPVGGNIPMNRPGDVHEVAAGVSFLASAAAGYITGVVLPIDGGYLVG
ncbi:SDR family NAD(P)-dependent oxidoreductase [Rhodococcus jostii]|uniref:SDR family NAD(P)-dependent oxidoreductase n=1 Tax=Rhodococcus jostii TaxID=132919 RepID=UPI00363B60F4